MPMARMPVFSAGVPTSDPLILTAGNGEQGEQQDDKRQVFVRNGLPREERGRPPAVDDQARQQEGDSPTQRYLTEVMVPDARQEQRHERDRQQDADKGRDPHQVQFGPGQILALTAGAIGQTAVPNPAVIRRVNRARMERRGAEYAGHGVS